MNRTQRKIDKIQREIAKLTDVGSKTEVQNWVVADWLTKANKDLDEAFLAAAREVDDEHTYLPKKCEYEGVWTGRQCSREAGHSGFHNTSADQTPIVAKG